MSDPRTAPPAAPAEKDKKEETAEEKAKREAERKMIEEICNRNANYWAAKHGLGGWKRIDKPSEDPLAMQDDDSMGITSGLNPGLGLLPPGIYRKEGQVDINYGEDGVVRPIGKFKDRFIIPDFKERYGAVLDFIAAGRGSATVTLEWDKPEHITLGKINDFLGLLEKRGMSLPKENIGKNVKDFIESDRCFSIIPPKSAATVRKEFYDRLEKLEAQRFDKSADHMQKNEEFILRSHAADLGKEPRLDNDPTKQAEQVKEAVLLASIVADDVEKYMAAKAEYEKDNSKDRPESVITPPTNSEKLKGVSDEIATLERRVESLQKSKKEIDSLIQKYEDKLKSSNPEPEKIGPLLERTKMQRNITIRAIKDVAKDVEIRSGLLRTENSNIDTGPSADTEDAKSKKSNTDRLDALDKKLRQFSPEAMDKLHKKANDKIDLLAKDAKTAAQNARPIKGK